MYTHSYASYDEIRDFVYFDDGHLKIVKILTLGAGQINSGIYIPEKLGVDLSRPQPCFTTQFQKGRH